MSSPIYTATAGPVDPNAKWRQYLYTGASILLKVVGLVVLIGGLRQGQADAIGQVVSGLLTLTGSVPADVAAIKTKAQRGNGTFDAAPDPVVVAPPISTAQQIADAIPGVIQAAADKQAEVDLIKSVAANTFGQLPVVGGLASDLINSIPSDLPLP